MATTKSAKRTTDHQTIRRWVEERNGHPARVEGTGGRGDPGMLRIDFPGFSGEGKLEQITWDEWFRKFDQERLAFLYEDEKNSRFNKLVSREGSER